MVILNLIERKTKILNNLIEDRAFSQLTWSRARALARKFVTAINFVPRVSLETRLQSITWPPVFLSSTDRTETTKTALKKNIFGKLVKKFSRLRDDAFSRSKLYLTASLLQRWRRSAYWSHRCCVSHSRTWRGRYGKVLYHTTSLLSFISALNALERFSSKLSYA